MSVIWITGLSGSGKTTIAKALVNKLTTKDKKIIFLDGDELRSIFKTDNQKKDYDIKNRRLNAQRISNLCCFLSSQGHDVIVATMSMFKETYKWNKENIENYFEVFIDLPKDKLIKRNSKKIYSQFNAGKLDNVVGMDLNFDKPLFPNLIVNSFNLESLNNIVDSIIIQYNKEILKNN